MSIPNDALQKEIEQKAAFSQQQISIVKAQLAAKSREKRMLQLTTEELDSLPNSTRVYEGAGKMFVRSPPDEVKRRLGVERDGISSDADALEKKLNYLETTYKNSQDHLNQLFKSGGR